MTVTFPNPVDTPVDEIRKQANPVFKPPYVAAHSDSATISDAAKQTAKIAGQ